MKNEAAKNDFMSRIDAVIAARWRFLFFFVLVFFVTLLVLSMVGFVPESQVGAALDQQFGGNTTRTSEYAEAGNPERIVIPSVDIDARIVNPDTRDVDVLDRALQSGVVHYPGTGTLAEDANIFLFGHSSYLPNVINKNYQVFNYLQKLEPGGEIFVDAGNTRYVYLVSSVALAEAADVTVDLTRGTRKLTLATCNSFGAKDERYIVEATYVGSYLLAI